VNVLFSVDWEPNHGGWDHYHGRDYGGILKATPILESVLEAQNVPCTWFVEAGKEADRDLPRLFASLLRGIAASRGNEIGLHVHWRRSRGNSGRITYETSDRAWVQEQVRYGVASLAKCGIKPTSFRSGALLSVDGLPGILEDIGFTADSSTLGGKANRFRSSDSGGDYRRTVKSVELVMRRLSGLPCQPYFADRTSVEKAGGSLVLEFPIFSGLLESRRPIYALLRNIALWRASSASWNTFVTFFFHIDELLNPQSGPNELAEVERGVVQLLSDLIVGLRVRNDVACLSMARELYLGTQNRGRRR
jgi:hypothetical protein